MLTFAKRVTSVNEQDRAQVAQLAQQVQDVTGETVKVAFADLGYTANSAYRRVSNMSNSPANTQHIIPEFADHTANMQYAWNTYNQ